MTPLKSGDGLATSAGPVLPLVVILVVVLAAALLLPRLRDGRVRGAVAIGGLVAVLAYVAVGRSDAIAFRDGASYVGPAASSGVDEASGVTTTLLDVKPNEQFRIAVTVTNVGLLPIRVRGLESFGTPAGPIPAFVGFGVLRDPNVFDPRDAVAFEPVSLGPGEHIDVVVLGDAGPCVAVGATDTNAQYVFDSILIAYDVLGWPRTTRVALPVRAAILAVDPCPPG